MKRCLFLILLILTFGLALQKAQAQEFDRINSKSIQPALSQPLQWVSADKAVASTLPNAFPGALEAWAPYTPSTVLPTSANQDVWVKFSFAPVSTPQSWVVRIPRLSVQKISLYSLDATGAWLEQSAGAKLAPSQWSRRTRTPSFEVLTSTVEQRYYMRLEDYSHITERPELMSHLEFSSSASQMGMLIGLMFGSYGFLIVACLTTFVIARNTVFLSLAAFIVSMLAHYLVAMGFGGWRLWPESAQLNQAMLWAVPFLALATGCWFFAQASHAKDGHKRIYLVLVALAALNACLCVIALVDLDQLSNKWMNAWTVGVLLTVTFSMAWLSWRDTGWSRWLLAGLLPLAGAVTARLLYNYGWLTHVEFVQVPSAGFSLLGLILFFLTLAWRSRDSLLSAEIAKGLAKIDPVTGLFNSRVAHTRLQQMLLRTNRLKLGCGVIMLRWVNYSKLMASQSPEQQSALLKQFSHVLTRLVRDIDTAAVLSRGCYVVLVEGPVSRDALASLSTQILAACIRSSEKFDLPNAFHLHIAVWQSDAVPSTPDKVIKALRTKLGDMPVGTKRMVQFVDSSTGDAVPEQDFDQRRVELLAKINAIEALPGFQASPSDINPGNP